MEEKFELLLNSYGLDGICDKSEVPRRVQVEVLEFLIDDGYVKLEDYFYDYHEQEEAVND